MEKNSSVEAAATAGGSGSGEGFTEAWLKEHHRAHEMATKHPFVLSIRDGTVDISSFKRWIEQDYFFVRRFLPFVASVLLKACKESDDEEDIEVILGGIAALHDEISWFKREALKWDISLVKVNPRNENKDYCRFLENLSLPDVDYTTAMVAFWAIETVYQESFSLCLVEGANTPVELVETCTRWGRAGFAQYCQTLREIADRRLKSASETTVKISQEVFLKVLEHEVHFWNMSSCEL